MTTPKLQLPELSVSQASKEITHNQALSILDQTAQLTVVSRTNTPPGSPANGAAYIVTATATGAWAGKETQIAYWLSSVAAWQFIVPANGWLAWSNADSKTYRLESGAWVELATGGGGVALAQVVAYAGTAKTLALTDINTIIDCTSSSSVTITIPLQSAVAWTADAEIHVRMSGTGVVSIAVGAGVTIPPLAAPIALSGQGAMVTLKRRSADVWAVVGSVVGGPDVVGPASAVDNEVARFDGTTGKKLKAGLKYQSSQTDTTAGALVIQGGQSLITSDAVATGFGAGSGGTVTQATSKSTGVTLNKPSGQITMSNAALAAGASVSFPLTNNKITTSDLLVVNAATNANYRVETAAVVAGGASIRVTNTTAGSLSDALLINFAVIKGATA